MCAAARVHEVHTIGDVSAGHKHLVHQMADDRRVHARLPVTARVRLKRVAGRPEARIGEFEGLDISCTGIRFRADRSLQPGTSVDLEVVLLEKGDEASEARGSAVKMFTSATVVRLDAPDASGMQGIAVAFDEIAISREPVR